MTRTDTLFFTEGSADKQYVLTLFPEGVGYTVVCYNGRRGGTLQTQQKTAMPVTLEAATKLYDRILAEKLRKGYLQGPDAAFWRVMEPVQSPGVEVSQREDALRTTPVTRVQDTDYKPMLLNPITDAEAEALLRDPAWLIQKKEDGVRAIIHVAHTDVAAWSRRGLPVVISAEAAAILRKHFAECILDGEVIGETVVLFDILNHMGVDLRAYAYGDRLRALRSKFQPLPKRCPVSMVLTGTTETEKCRILAKLRVDGSEGAVFKKANARYIAGRPNSGGNAVKLKFTATATLTIIAIGSKGKTSCDVATADGTKVASVSLIGRPPVQVGQLAEISYLYAYRGGSLVQPVFKSLRPDKTHADATASLQFKGEER